MQCCVCVVSGDLSLVCIVSRVMHSWDVETWATFRSEMGHGFASKVALRISRSRISRKWLCSAGSIYMCGDLSLVCIVSRVMHSWDVETWATFRSEMGHGFVSKVALRISRKWLCSEVVVQ